MLNVLVLLDKSENMKSIKEYIKHITTINFTIIPNLLFNKQYHGEHYDILIYQAFPHENNKKYNRKQNNRTDNFFLNFKGKKLLYDTHDDGNIDGFLRFKRQYNRIKTTAAYDSMGEYSVKFILGDPVFYNSELTFNNYPIYYFSYNCGYKSHGYGHFIREQTRDILLASDYKIDMDFHKQFEKHVKNCRVMICPPGNCGAYPINFNLKRTDYSKYKKITGSELLPCGISRRHLYCLKYGVMLLAYKSFSNIKLFNDVDLVEGVDYMTYDLSNLTEKLDFCYHNVDKVDEIRRNGQLKFKAGGDIVGNSLKFAKFLEEY